MPARKAGAQTSSLYHRRDNEGGNRQSQPQKGLHCVAHFEVINNMKPMLSQGQTDQCQNGKPWTLLRREIRFSFLQTIACS
ncbi:hypothetical protein Ancab_007498, partial [Ancistrocladus abbreviatus]